MSNLSHGTHTRVQRLITIALVVLLVFLPGIAFAGSGDASAGAGDASAVPVGALSVDSDPAGAAVYVDGRFAGQTPVSMTKLATGDHRVRVVKDGYLENGRTVSVSAKQPSTVQVTLTRNAAANADVASQVTGSTGGGGGGSKKWIWIGAAAGGGAAALVLLAKRNSNTAPTIASITPNPTKGIAARTSISYSDSTTDP